MVTSSTCPHTRKNPPERVEGSLIAHGGQCAQPIFLSSAWGCPQWRRWDLHPRPSGYEPDELLTAPLRSDWVVVVESQRLPVISVFDGRLRKAFQQLDYWVLISPPCFASTFCAARPERVKSGDAKRPPTREKGVVASLYGRRVIGIPRVSHLHLTWQHIAPRIFGSLFGGRRVMDPCGWKVRRREHHTNGGDATMLLWA